MSEEVKNFFATYSDFVTKVTSEPSLDMESLKKSMDDIESNSSIKMPRLLTAALGLGSETGEFVEIVKKMVLQGKPASEDNIFHKFNIYSKISDDIKISFKLQIYLKL